MLADLNAASEEYGMIINIKQIRCARDKHQGRSERNTTVESLMKKREGESLTILNEEERKTRIVVGKLTFNQMRRLLCGR